MIISPVKDLFVALFFASIGETTAATLAVAGSAFAASVSAVYSAVTASVIVAVAAAIDVAITFADFFFLLLIVTIPFRYVD